MIQPSTWSKKINSESILRTSLEFPLKAPSALEKHSLSFPALFPASRREVGFVLCWLEILTSNQYHLPPVCPAKKGLQTLHANRGLGISHKQGQSVSEHLVFQQLMYELRFKQDCEPL